MKRPQLSLAPFLQGLQTSPPMNRPFALLPLAALVFATTLPLPAAAADPVAWPTEYTAEIVTTGKDIPGEMVTKYAIDGEKIRSEVNAQGQQMISIIRPDRKVMYTVMPAQKMYMEMPLQDSPAGPGGADFKAQAEKFRKGEGIEEVGKETINGVACTKYKATDGENVSLFWISETTRHPVRIAAADGSYQVDWKNVKVGKPDASLFEPPADCKKMAVPGMPGAGGS